MLIGQTWRHNKTDSLYRIVCLSVDEVRLVALVTYAGIGEPTEKRTWTRDLDVFLSKNDEGAWRFSYVSG